MAKNVLTKFPFGRFIELVERDRVAWTPFPGNPIAPISVKGIARRLRTPAILLRPSQDLGTGTKPDCSTEPLHIEDRAIRLLDVETARSPASRGEAPDCLAPFLKATRGIMVYYEQLWAVLMALFNQNMANAEIFAFRLCRGGANAEEARAQLVRLAARGPLSRPHQDCVVKYIAASAPVLTSRAYFIGTAFSRSAAV